MPPVIRQKPREQTRTNVNDLDRETLILLELPGQGPALITVWLQV